MGVLIMKLCVHGLCVFLHVDYTLLLEVWSMAKQHVTWDSHVPPTESETAF